MWGRADFLATFIGEMAEAVRFELTDGCPSPVFKTGAIDHSATLPVPTGILGAGPLGLVAAHLHHLAATAIHAHGGECAAPDLSLIHI